MLIISGLPFFFNQVSCYFRLEFLHLYYLMEMVVQIVLRVSFEHLFGGFTNHDVAFFTVALHFVGDRHILAVDVVPDNIRADDSSVNGACVDSDSHIEALVVDFDANFPDDLDHFESELHDVEGLFLGVSLAGVNKAHSYVAVSDCVDFVDIVFLAHPVELSKQAAQHKDHVFRPNAFRIGGKSSDICK